ncbi:MAG: hypothetical protein HYX60_04850 [Legionella longbeachae]|nr:hypothetical protein [Legionella longbeachae]
MGNPNQNLAFRNDKNDFFMNLKTDIKSKLTKEEITKELEELNSRPGEIGYTFILQNQKSLEDEFKHMFAALNKQKEENIEAFWLYCYYCATLLEAFHKAYSQASKEAEYKEIKLHIKNRLLNNKEEKKDAPSQSNFIESMQKSFIDGFKHVSKAPYHLSQIRDYVAFSNLCRVYWVFCRLNLTTGLTIAKDLHLIEKFDLLLGTHTNVDGIISFLQAPNGVLNYFSVGLFLARFIIEGILLTKHTFFPTTAEKKDKNGNEITAYDRFKHELYKRHCNFANDLVWATVNFLTNFNQITHIPGPIAGALTAVFLGFDVCMALYKCHLAKQEYLIKEEQYLQEIEDYKNPEMFQFLTQEQKSAHIKIREKQRAELFIDWKTKEATLHFVAAGAVLLMTGFSAALLFTPPGMVLASFFVCLVGTSMYLSAGSYAKQKEASLRLEQAHHIRQNISGTHKDSEAASNDFIFTMIKNTVMPTFMIATFALYFPAALALTVMYAGYEMYHAYDQHNCKKESAQLALAAPDEEYEPFNDKGVLACRY